jgi:hypothetical protein
MADLYDRILDIQGMTRVLGEDVDRIRPLLGPRNIQQALSPADEGSRRFYVRAIFALVEAVVEQHKRLLLDLAERQAVALDVGVREALSERTVTVRDNGAIGEREQYLQLQKKLRLVYRTAGQGFGEEVAVDFGDAGWASFQDAISVRDRITHPKTFEDCHVDDDALDTVERGHDWFRNLNAEFVRIARQHRNNHQW